MLNAGNLTAIASAFSDHAYASNPGNSTPIRVEKKAVLTDIPKEVDTSVGMTQAFRFTVYLYKVLLW